MYQTLFITPTHVRELFPSHEQENKVLFLSCIHFFLACVYVCVWMQVCMSKSVCVPHVQVYVLMQEEDIGCSGFSIPTLVP